MSAIHMSCVDEVPMCDYYPRGRLAMPAAGQSAQTVPVDVGAERNEVEAAFMRTMTKRGIPVEVEVLRRQKAEMCNLSAVKRQSILVCKARADNVQAMRRFDRCWLFHGTHPNTAHTIIS